MAHVPSFCSSIHPSVPLSIHWSTFPLFPRSVGHPTLKMVFMVELAGGRGEQIITVMVTWGPQRSAVMVHRGFRLLWQQPPNLGLGLGSEFREEWQLGPGRWMIGGRRGKEGKRGGQSDQRTMTDRPINWRWPHHTHTHNYTKTPLRFKRCAPS